MKRFPLFVLAGIVAACGGSGGDSGTNTPPPPPPVATVTVSVSPTSAAVGGAAQATATLKSSSGSTLTGRQVLWSSSNGGVASVSSAGGITAIAEGSTTITAISEGVSGAASFSVTPKPVASVTVALGSPTLLPGAITAAIATLRDNNGVPLAGRSVTWSSSNQAVGTVASNGQVTAVAPGTTNITAMSEGITGFAVLTVTQPPVATLTLFGTERIKVGDSYQFTVEARLADGTLVQRPIAWSIVEAGKALINANGVLVATTTGAITVKATVEGVTVTGNLTAYDWRLITGSGVIALFLAADLPITNQFNQSEYPDLVIGCGSGTFIVYVGTQRFVTASGGVAYSFNGGTILSDVWLETSDFHSLIYPGLTNLSQKSFAATIASSSTFGFAFNEFLAGAHATIFRVTGLSSLIGTVLSACPSNLLLAPDAHIPTPDELVQLLGGTRSASPNEGRRKAAGAQAGSGAASALGHVGPTARVRLSRP